MIWLCLFFFALIMGLAGEGWFWLPLVLVLAFLDVAYVRPPQNPHF